MLFPKIPFSPEMDLQELLIKGLVSDFALSDKNEEMLIYDEIHDLIHKIKPLSLEGNS